MRYEITIPYEDLHNTIGDDMHRLKKLGVEKSAHVLLDGWEIECTPEVLMMVLLTIDGSRVLSVLPN